MKPLAEVLTELEKIAPLELAEPWDNVGLLVGDRSANVSRTMLTIDYTDDVAAEARAAKCDFVISYHPVIFEGHKRITSARSTRLIFDAIREGVAIYSPHTALDAAEGGTNDVLADTLSLAGRKPLRYRESKPTHYKLVTFVPPDAVDRVADALFAAGAGQIGGIGNYTNCSFRSPGTGTFKGNDDSNPAVGEAGKFERVEEMRLEVILEKSYAQVAVDALRKAHPYEEVAFDLQVLAPLTVPAGIGRVGRLPSEITLEMVANLLKRSIGVDHLLLAGEKDTMIKTVAICAGAGGELVKDVLASKADLYITGELRHHSVLELQRAGINVICTLHTNSERLTLRHLSRRLTESVPGVEFMLSKSDRDPFWVY
jgi:dinuclear metal center YbgI/SA1388 family protein